MAAASVIRTSSRLGVRSTGMRSSGSVPLTCIGGVTLVRNRGSRTQQALRGVLDEWQWFSHRTRDRHAVARHLDRVEAKRLMSLTEAARDCHDRNARASSGCGHRTGELSVAALSIDATLSGDDEVCANEAFVEPDGSEHQVGSGDETCIEEREETRAKAARRTSAGHVADRPADECLYDIGVPRERGVELADDLGPRALLRPVNRGRTFGAKKRIANGAGHVDRRTDQARIGLAVDATQTYESRAALGKLVAVTIEKAVPKGARHSSATVVGRAAADSDHDPMRATRGRREDQLSGAAGARDARVAFARFEERKPARRRHLHDGGRAVTEDAPLGVDLATERVVHA